MSNFPNSYNGNPHIKGDGVQQNFTQHEVVEYQRCMSDVAYFCEKYVKVIHLDHGLTPFKLRGYQTKMTKHFSDNRFSIILAPRQSGKSVTSVAWLLHYVIFHPDKTVGILANKGSTSREMLSRLTLMLENLPFFLQPGCKVLNKGSIKFSNNSQIIAAATSSSSIRGLSMNCVSGDTKICIKIKGSHIFYGSINTFIANSEKNKRFDTRIPILVSYKIVNSITNQTYIGRYFTTDPNDGYFGSGQILKDDIIKFGIDNFTKEIVKIFSPDGSHIINQTSLQGDIAIRLDDYTIQCSDHPDVITGIDSYIKSEFDKDIEVLTHCGFKSFDTILDQGISKQLLKISFKHKDNLKCTADHKLLIFDGKTYVAASLLKVGDSLYGGAIVESIDQIENEPVYDLLNVQDTHAYYSNGLVSHNCIFLDEFAFVQNANEFYTSTYPVISSGKDTKVIITSTPNGVGNMFYTLWESAIQNTSEFKPFVIRWQDVPGRDEAWKKQTIANSSEAQFRQEFSCIGGDSMITVLDTITNVEMTIPISQMYSLL
jgi:hypothetical protein